MNISGANEYIAIYPLEEVGMGKLVDSEEECLVFFKPPETIHRYTVDDTEIMFIHREDILGYLQ